MICVLFHLLVAGEVEVREGWALGAGRSSGIFLGRCLFVLWHESCSYKGAVFVVALTFPGEGVEAGWLLVAVLAGFLLEEGDIVACSYMIGGSRRKGR